MQERPQTFDADEDTELTLATPRFDADETRRAHAVVPLEEAPARTYGARKSPRGGARRTWPLSLIVVALLAVAAAGGIATKVLRRPRNVQPAPASVVAAPLAVRLASAAPPAHESERVSRHAGRARSAREPRDEQTEEVSLPPGVFRDGDEDSDEKDERRGKEKHRKHEGDDDERDSRKADKHGKKQPRLVDILKGP